MRKNKFLACLCVTLSVTAMSVLASCGGGKEEGGDNTPSQEVQKVAVTSVVLNFTEIDIEKGGTQKLIASVFPTNADNKKVTWISSSEDIVTVDQNGLITAKAPGTAAIQVVTEDGNKKAACTVTVNEPLPEATETVTITFRECFGQLIKDNLNAQISDFQRRVQREERVKVNVVLNDSSNYQSLESDILADFSTGVYPNLTVAYPDHVANYMEEEAKKGASFIVKLDDLAKDQTIGFGREEWLGDDTKYTNYADIIPSYLEEGQQFTREGTYVLPFMKSTEAMYYNVKLVQKAFAKYKPEINNVQKITQYMKNITWDDFMELCKTIVDNKDDYGKNFTSSAFYDSDSNMFITGLFQKGISYSYIKEGHGYIGFSEGENRTKAEEFIEKLKGYHDYGKNKGVSALTTKAADGTYGSNSFKEEKTVFSIGSTGGAGYNMTTDFQIGVCKVPTFGDNHVYVSQGPSLAIMKDPKKSDAENEKLTKYTWKLLKYLTNKEVNTQLCLDGSEGYLPVRESAYGTKKFLSWQATGGYLVDTANVTLEDIDNHFLSTACFKGSSELRKQVGSAIGTYFVGNSKELSSAKDVVDYIVSQTSLKM